MRNEKGKRVKQSLDLSDFCDSEDHEDTDSDGSKSLDYDPVHFLRCHSKKNDSSDVQTQVWQCAFEPDASDPCKTTSLVATCGGNSVCFIDVASGAVKLKYNAKDLREMLYALAWTVAGDDTLLVVGGTRYTLHFIHPASGLALHIKPLKVKGNKNHINSLLFYPQHPNLLLCGSNNGEIHICNIGNPTSPEFDIDVMIVQSFSANSEVFSLSYCSTNNILLAGCDGGLLGWSFPKIIDTTSEIPLKQHKFTLPVRSSNLIKEQELVDSVEVIGNGLVATKCALHGAIYLWSLSDTLNCRDGENLLAVLPSHVLRWSPTDNYFMFIGAQEVAGLLCCGDDKGALWLYDLRKLSSATKQTHQSVEPAQVLLWPQLSDPNADKKRKLAVDTYDIVVDKVALSSDRRHIVAVTNNNMVCIWQRA